MKHVIENMEKYEIYVIKSMEILHKYGDVKYRK